MLEILIVALERNGGILKSESENPQRLQQTNEISPDTGLCGFREILHKIRFILSRIIHMKTLFPGQQKSTAAYSLMELLVAVSIIAMFSSIALPSIDSLFNSEAATSHASTLTSDVRFARAWSLENQTYVRIVFNPDDYSSWVVQELTDNLGETISGDPGFTMTTAEMNDFDENPTYWRSIIDAPSREIDIGNIRLVFTPSVPPAIFFRPDGLLVSSPNSSANIFGTLNAKFLYDASGIDSGIEVDITPSGAIESSEYEDY